MVTNPTYTILRHLGVGPTFGAGNDLRIADNADSNSNFGISYSAPSGVQDKYTILAGTFYFTPDVVEVFYLG